jgi:hypothetical protein
MSHQTSPHPPLQAALPPVYGSITCTHLKENFSMVKLPYLCKKSKGKPVWVNCTWEAGVARHGCRSAALHHVALVVPKVSLMAAMLTARPSSPLSTNHRVGISHHHQPCATRRAGNPSAAVITVGRPKLRLRPGGGAAQQTGRIVGAAVAGQAAQSHQLMMAAGEPIAVLLLLFLALFPGLEKTRVLKKTSPVVFFLVFWFFFGFFGFFSSVSDPDPGGQK